VKLCTPVQYDAPAPIDRLNAQGEGGRSLVAALPRGASGGDENSAVLSFLRCCWCVLPLPVPPLLLALLLPVKPLPLLLVLLKWRGCCSGVLAGVAVALGAIAVAECTGSGSCCNVCVCNACACNGCCDGSGATAVSIQGSSVSAATAVSSSPVMTKAVKVSYTQRKSGPYRQVLHCWATALLTAATRKALKTCKLRNWRDVHVHAG
jgi:hypothetical protein